MYKSLLSLCSRDLNYIHRHRRKRRKVYKSRFGVLSYGSPSLHWFFYFARARQCLAGERESAKSAEYAGVARRQVFFKKKLNAVQRRVLVESRARVLTRWTCSPSGRSTRSRQTHR